MEGKFNRMIHSKEFEENHSKLKKKKPKHGFGALLSPCLGQGPMKWTEIGPTNDPWMIWDEFETFCNDHFCKLKLEYTGWSLKTVDCNFFLTDPKNSKSAKTQWFSESLYREVLVFWCFKIVRCVNFAFQSFSNKEHLLHHSRP